MTLRRTIDVAVAGAGLFLLIPVLAGIMIAVLVIDGRPVLFVQCRSGLGGRGFRLFKFRTMATRNDAAGKPLPDCLRVTILGRLLRASRLDELPQLWNVLIGDMSLIGPRPLFPETISDAGAAGQLRGQSRPGLTGLAQVSGNTLLSDADKISLDNWYVANRSIGLDLAIIGRTALVAIWGERFDPVAIRRARACSDHRRG